MKLPLERFATLATLASENVNHHINNSALKNDNATAQLPAGLLLVDSTRRGKRAPDAFTRTVPLWLCALHLAVAAELTRAGDAVQRWAAAQWPQVLSLARAHARARARNPATAAADAVSGAAFREAPGVENSDCEPGALSDARLCEVPGVGYSEQVAAVGGLPLLLLPTRTQARESRNTANSTNSTVNTDFDADADADEAEAEAEAEDDDEASKWAAITEIETETALAAAFTGATERTSSLKTHLFPTPCPEPAAPMLLQAPAVTDTTASESSTVTTGSVSNTQNLLTETLTVSAAVATCTVALFPLPTQPQLPPALPPLERHLIATLALPRLSKELAAHCGARLRPLARALVRPPTRGEVLAHLAATAVAFHHGSNSRGGGAGNNTTAAPAPMLWSLRALPLRPVWLHRGSLAEDLAAVHVESQAASGGAAADKSDSATATASVTRQPHPFAPTSCGGVVSVACVDSDTSTDSTTTPEQNTVAVGAAETATALYLYSASRPVGEAPAHGHSFLTGYASAAGGAAGAEDAEANHGGGAGNGCDSAEATAAAVNKGKGKGKSKSMGVGAKPEHSAAAAINVPKNGNDGGDDDCGFVFERSLGAGNEADSNDDDDVNDEDDVEEDSDNDDNSVTGSRSVSAIAAMTSAAPVDVTVGVSREWTYVQGAGDDEETWARGLTPELFWANRVFLLSSRGAADCDARIAAVIAGAQGADAVTASSATTAANGTASAVVNVTAAKNGGSAHTSSTAVPVQDDWYMRGAVATNGNASVLPPPGAGVPTVTLSDATGSGLRYAPLATAAATAAVSISAAATSDAAGDVASRVALTVVTSQASAAALLVVVAAQQSPCDKNGDRVVVRARLLSPAEAQKHGLCRSHTKQCSSTSNSNCDCEGGIYAADTPALLLTVTRSHADTDGDCTGVVLPRCALAPVLSALTGHSDAPAAAAVLATLHTSCTVDVDNNATDSSAKAQITKAKTSKQDKQDQAGGRGRALALARALSALGVLPGCASDGASVSTPLDLDAAEFASAVAATAPAQAAAAEAAAQVASIVSAAVATAASRCGDGFAAVARVLVLPVSPARSAKLSLFKALPRFLAAAAAAAAATVSAAAAQIAPLLLLSDCAETSTCLAAAVMLALCRPSPTDGPGAGGVTVPTVTVGNVLRCAAGRSPRFALCARQCGAVNASARRAAATGATLMFGVPAVLPPLQIALHSQEPSGVQDSETEHDQEKAREQEHGVGAKEVMRAMLHCAMAAVAEAEAEIGAGAGAGSGAGIYPSRGFAQELNRYFCHNAI